MDTLNHVLSLVEAFDVDNDDRITQAELGGILGLLGYNAIDQEVGATMQQGDKNKDGLLCIREFLELNTKDMDGGNLVSTLNTTFEALDEDESEVLIGEELHGMVQKLRLDLTLENRVHFVASLDADENGGCELGRGKGRGKGKGKRRWDLFLL